MTLMLSVFAKSSCLLTASFFISSYAFSKDYYVACYYSDSNVSLNSKNPELMLQKLGPSTNYYWAIESNSFFPKYTKLKGKIVDGFFVEESLSYNDIIKQCNFAIDKGTILWSSEKSYVLMDFKASESDLSGYEYPILFTNEKNNKSQINQIVLFGDSLSDTGNLKRWTKVMPYFPFWFGRFSDGLIWVDFLSRRLQIPLLNFSYGGAKTDGTNKSYVKEIPDYLKTIGRNLVTGNSKDYIKSYLTNYLTTDSYVTKNSRITNPKETLYIVWIGANDYLEKFENKNLTKPFLDDPEHPEGINQAYKKTVSNIIEQVSMINDKGGKYFLLLNIPDLGRSPLVLTSTYNKYDDEYKNKEELSRRLSELTGRHNDLLKESLEILQKKLGNKIDITLLDVDANFSDMLDDISIVDKSHFDYGFKKINSKFPKPESKDKYIQDFCYVGGYINAIFKKSNEEASKFAFENSCKLENGELNKFSIFYNSPHPTSYAHCWLSYSIEKTIQDKGFLSNHVGSLSSFKEYCVDQINSNGKLFN